MLLTPEEIKEALKKTLPKLSNEDIERAAKAIVESNGKWREVDLTENLGAAISVQCADICCLGEAYSKGKQIKAFISN